MRSSSRSFPARWSISVRPRQYTRCGSSRFGSRGSRFEENTPPIPLVTRYSLLHVQGRIVVLRAGLLHVAEPVALIDGVRPLRRVHETPRLPLVRPVRGVQPMRGAEMADRVVRPPEAMEVLAEFELR